MKKHVKVLLCLSAGLISLGLVLSTIGLATGAKLDQVLDGGYWLLTHDDGSSVQREHPFSAEGQYTLSPEGIQDLSVDWLDGEITIAPYEGREIRIQETSPVGLTEKNSLSYTTKNGTLSISTAPVQHMIGISSTRGISNKTLLIQLPADLVLRDAELAVADAEISLSGLHLQGLTIDALDGDIRMADTSADTLDLDCADGDLLLENCQIGAMSLNNLDGDTTAKNCSITSLDLNTASGSFSGDLTLCPEAVNVESLDGSVELSLPADSQFTASFTALDGAYHSTFPGVFANDTHTVGNGSAQFSMDTMDGDLTILPQE